jgi:branched-chain amino acid transport system permease protein
MSDASSAPTTTAASRGGSHRPVVGRVVGIVLLVVAAALPFLHRVVPGFFDGPLDSPGVLHLVALMLVFGALAITYDLLFGYTGLLSFGHALYFALGVYGTVVMLTKFSLGLGGTLLVVAIAGIVVPLVIGLICLRVNGIAFAMVTLAFAQAGTIFVTRDPLRVTGGELGKALPFEHVPAALTGVLNTRNVYWVALVLLVVVYAVSRVATASPTGRVWQGIRENERRVEVLGLNPTWYKLAVFVLASFLATLCGVVYVLVVGGASPTVTTSTFTLTLLVMVVLGGAGRLWGAMLGGMLYTYLDNRLAQLATSGTVQELPSWVRVPLSEPLFVLGLLFVVVVLYLPGGVAGLVSGWGARSTGTRGPGNRLRALVRRGEARGSEADDNESAPRRQPPAMDSRTHEEVGQR